MQLQITKIIATVIPYVVLSGTLTSECTYELNVI